MHVRIVNRGDEMTLLRRLPISFWFNLIVAVGSFVLAVLSLISDGISATVALALLVALATGGGCISAYQESVREHDERVNRENDIIDKGDALQITRLMERLSKREQLYKLNQPPQE